MYPPAYLPYTCRARYRRQLRLLVSEHCRILAHLSANANGSVSTSDSVGCVFQCTYNVDRLYRRYLLGLETLQCLLTVRRQLESNYSCQLRVMIAYQISRGKCTFYSAHESRHHRVYISQRQVFSLFSIDLQELITRSVCLIAFYSHLSS